MAGIGGISPGFFNSYDNSLQRQSPYQYDPSQYVDPTQAIAAQQQMAKQIFAMQNPRLALPQQFGSAIGNYLAQQVNPNTPQNQSQQQPQQDPVTAAIKQARQKLVQQGITDPGESLFKAATQVMNSGQFDDNPHAEQILDKAMTWSTKQYGYDPELQRKMDMEAQNKSAENIKLPNGKTVSAPPGTPQYKAYIDAGGIRAADLPQQTPGSVEKWDINGRLAAGQVGPQGQPVDLKHPTVTSSSPMQYQVSDTASGMGSAGLLGSTGTTAAADKARKEGTDREIATVNAVRGMDNIVDNVKSSNGASVGTFGDIMEKGQNIVSTAQNFASYAGQGQLLDPKTYNWKGLDASIGTMKGNAAAATKYHSLMLSAAYMMAAAQSPNNTDEKMTRQRVEANLDILAEHSDDPQIVVSTIQNASQMLKDNLRTQAKGYGLKTPLLDDYEAGRNGSQSPQPTRPGQSSSPYKSDGDIKSAYKAGKITKEQAMQELKRFGYT